MPNAELDSRILEIVSQPGYRPVKPRGIARVLKTPPDEVTEVKRAVKRLIREGKLVYGPKHLVMLPGGVVFGPDGKRPLVEDRTIGVFRRAQGGFGFVRPTPDTPVTAQPVDIYIAAEDTADASSGDVVLVKQLPGKGRRDLGPRGKILEIIERQTHQFVGTYFEQGGGAFVQVDGTVISQPVYVGDPGAKAAQPGDKVVFEMVRFPSYVRDGEGVITEVLGPHGKPGVDTLSVIREFGLPEQFPPEVLDEARAVAEAFDESHLGDRLDLTDRTIITIDPADARDFDDAISLETREDGHWLLGVHIADVGHFVAAGGLLDGEAYDRATSVYLPDRVIPMLPEVISNALASLQPEKTRYTKTVFLEYTPEGVLVNSEFHSSAIKSTRRLTYEQVDEYLADPAAVRKKLGARVCDLLGQMHRLAMILRRRRAARGALELTMPEVKVDLDRQGRVAGAHVVPYTESHQVIEEFMLAANEAVAALLRDREIRFLRRVHRIPTQRKMQVLSEFVRELGFQVESLEDRFALQKLLREVVDQPEQYAVNYAVLRSMARAVYSPAEEGHYALASDCYCHFTSPIRRYPDLTVHRLLDAVLAGKKPPENADQLLVQGQHCSDREQRAEAAERELVKLKLLIYLSGRIGEQMDAIITGVESFGFFAQGVELPAEGLVPIAALRGDYYDFDRAAHTLSGRRAGNAFRLGDRVRVAVARVDLERRELDFQLVAHHARPKKAGRRGEKKRGRPADSRKGRRTPKPAKSRRKRR